MASEEVFQQSLLLPTPKPVKTGVVGVVAGGGSPRLVQRLPVAPAGGGTGVPCDMMCVHTCVHQTVDWLWCVHSVEIRVSPEMSFTYLGNIPGASPQIPATAYFGVSFMHTGGVLGVYNARVLLEGANDGD